MASDKSEQFVLLNHLADEFAERYRRGERPSLQEYIDRHPGLAADIREFFPALVEMEQVKQVRALVPNTAPTGPLPTLERLGDYRIIREIGHGGMGVVYEAEQISLGRRVALKVMTARTLRNADYKRRFEREAKAAAKLHHTNIVPVFGTGEHAGTPYYVMQFIQGTGLDVIIAELAQLGSGAKSLASPAPGTTVARQEASAIVKSLCTGVYRPAHNGGLDATCDLAESPPDLGFVASPAGATEGPSLLSSTSSSLKLPGPGGGSSSGAGRRLTFAHSVARVGLQVADALEHAHRQGIVHRDIKPSNLLLDLAGTVWVTDFGLAKADDSEDLTQSGDILGTIRYVPPEAFDGKSDARGDVYALGLTLYELLGGRPAFAESDRNKLIKLVTTSEPTRLDRLCPTAPRDLVTVIHKAIEREPSARYQRAQDLAEDLRRFLEDRSVKARRATLREKTVRWVRRNPAVAACLGGIVAIVLMAFALISFSYVRAEEARHFAEKREKAERWERYRANLIAVGSAMQLHNVSAAQSALEAAPEEHRNWEWRYFSHQFDTAQQIIRFGEGVRALEVSPDGTLAAVQPASGPARLWDVVTRQEIGSLSNRSPLERFWFSPDGKVLASAHGDTYRLWDVPAGRERATFTFQRTNMCDLQFSPDGSRLTSGSPDGTAHIWDTATGRLASVLRGHVDLVRQAVFSTDGRRIVSAGWGDRTARLWDAETGQALAILAGHEDAVGQAIFSPQGDRVLSQEAYPSNALRLWDTATGKLLKVMHGHTNGAEVMAFSSDGSRIASGGLDRTIRVWNGRTGEPLWSREGHRGAIQSVAFSPDGKYVISGSLDQTARLWDAATGTPLGVLHGHTGAIQWNNARYTRDGRTVVTASVADGTVRLWDARRAEWNGSLRGHESFVYSVAFHPDGEWVASAAWDGTVRIWHATTGQQILNLSYPFPPATEHKVVSSVAFHPAGSLVAAFGRDGAVHFWNLVTAKEEFSFRLPPGSVYDFASDPRVAFNSHGNLLAVPGGSDNCVHVWDVERRTKIAVLKGHSGAVLEACFSPDDSWLATVGDDRTVGIWDVGKQEQIRLLEGHTDQLQAVTVSRDGKWLASGSKDGTVRLWDTTTWKEAAVLKHGTIVYGVAFSPDGTRLASACANNLIRFWDMKTFQLVAELDGHSAYVHQIAFSPDGTRLVSGSGDHTVRIWDSLSVQERTERAKHASRP
jgi:WD40 repeat protein/serine/threonine protein kinase